MLTGSHINYFLQKSLKRQHDILIQGAPPVYYFYYLCSMYITVVTQAMH